MILMQNSRGQGRAHAHAENAVPDRPLASDGGKRANNRGTVPSILLASIDLAAAAGSVLPARSALASANLPLPQAKPRLSGNLNRVCVAVCSVPFSFSVASGWVGSASCCVNQNREPGTTQATLCAVRCRPWQPIALEFMPVSRGRSGQARLRCIGRRLRVCTSAWCAIGSLAHMKFRPPASSRSFACCNEEILTDALRGGGRAAFRHQGESRIRNQPNEVSARRRASSRSVAVSAVKYRARPGGSYRAEFQRPQDKRATSAEPSRDTGATIMDRPAALSIFLRCARPVDGGNASEKAEATRPTSAALFQKFSTTG
jgi:hypothetical protein